MPDANAEYAISVYYTKEAIERYKNWLKENVQFTDVEIIDAPQYADFDYYVYVNGYLNHLLEVKTRRHRAGTYGMEKMPLRKHAVAAYFMRAEKLKTIYLCSWLDRISILELWKNPDQVTTMVARYDRGGDKDIYALYDYTRFKAIIVRDRPAAPPPIVKNWTYKD